MHKRYILAFVMVLIASTPAKLFAQSDRDSIESVHTILREACDLARQHNKSDTPWFDMALLEIGRIQVETGDFDGAGQSIRASNYDYGRGEMYRLLALALAHSGKLDSALDIVRLYDTSDGCGVSHASDEVRLAWAEFHTGLGNLGLAGNAINNIDSSAYRAEGLYKLAASFARSGDKLQAREYFAKSLEIAASTGDGSRKTDLALGAAKTQMSIGDFQAAKQTLQSQLVSSKSQMALDRVWFYKESAVLYSVMNDNEEARRLFRKAIDEYKEVDSLNKANALKYVALAQVRAGFIGDARKTSNRIEPDNLPLSSGGECERILSSIAMWKLEQGDIYGGIQTAAPIQDEDCHDDVLARAIDLLLVKRDLRAALAITAKLTNYSKKAVAKLKVATAFARAGDRKTAINIAGNIRLTHKNMLLMTTSFDYRKPQSWWISREPSFTIGSHFRSVKRAAEVASAAAEFAIAVAMKLSQPYNILLADEHEMTVRSIARTQARWGDSTHALEWVGRLRPPNPNRSESGANLNALKRVHGLIGVAEGILDRNVPSRRWIPTSTVPTLFAD